MKHKTRNENFSTIGGRTVNEIRDWVLYEAQNNKTRYNELVKDFEDYINRNIGIGPDISTTKTEKEITDPRAQELQPLTAGEFEFEPPYRLVFDFITTESNGVKLSSLKVSCRPYDERERISNYVYQAFLFREGCKLAIVELLEPQQVTEPTPAKNKAEKTFFDFINCVKDKEAFANDLKDTFNTEYGIDFKIMIELLKEESIFLIGGREFKKFYGGISGFFSRDIGTYQSINDPKILYDSDKMVIQTKLKPLIKKYKA